MSRYGGRGDKADLDNHSNQLNPNNDEYKGGASDKTDDDDDDYNDED